jgi:hypothetical protein
MATPPSGASTWLTINGKPIRFDSADENAGLNIVEYSRYHIKITKHAPNDLTLIIEDQELETERYGHWLWRPQHFAGLYQIVVEAPDYPSQTTWIRVFPQKLTQPLYEKMKADLSTIALDLQFHLDSPARERATYAPQNQEASPLRDYKKIHSIIDQLRDIMLRIRREPYYALHKQTVQQGWEQVTSFTNEVMPLAGESITLPEALTHRHGISHIPQHWMAQQNYQTYNVYENRLLKQFIQKQLIAKLEIIQQRAENEKKRIAPIYARYHNKEDESMLQKLKQVTEDCQHMKQRCISWSSEPFLNRVSGIATEGKATQLLLKHPTYSRFYALYLQFQQELKVTLETERYVTELALRRVSALYEMWSVFFMTKLAIKELLSEGYHIVSRTLFYEVEKNYFQFDVRKNVASIVLEKETARVEFKYEPVYPNQSTVFNRSAIVATTFGTNPLTPDMAIEVYKDNEPQHVLIFDAKYRYHREQGGAFYPEEHDIDVMYRYYRNIRYKHYQPGKAHDPYSIKNIVSSAYILYPGNRIYAEDEKRIGGLPLTPNIAPQRLNEIREHLKDLLYYAYLID